MTNQLLLLASGDDVAIALDELAPGATAAAGDGTSVTAVSAIPRGHKVALSDLAAGTLVHKYGHVIGVTTAPVRAGEHLHVHNLAMPKGASALASGGGQATTALTLPADLRRTFMGIRRPDGRVGTRNYVGVLTTVNCSATVARQVARRTEDAVAALHPDGVDGVVALTHGTGCGMADSGEGWDLLRKTLQGYARHPNIGALVVIGLGCEVNSVTGLIDSLGVDAAIPIEHFTIQDVGGTAAAITEGEKYVTGLAEDLRGTRRTEVGVEHLVLGLNCGGSDAWSGLTANPALGVASDLLVA
ncbi:MAG: UxaA family hydrolase, partial [Intrasporangium sp.]|uniref:UxaA family hydrolase n=1 Tax=Intrasporangium sp. TaxID=1925024 RepID=UPI003F7D9272